MISLSTEWAPTNPNAISIFVITWNPSDAPGYFVVRRHEISAGVVTACEAMKESSLSEARAKVPEGKQNMDRSVLDDPVIVETWM